MTRIEQLCHVLGWRPSAADVDVAAIESALGLPLPLDYQDFLATTDGFEGIIGEVYLVLLGPTELVAANARASIAEFHPAHVLIGGNGAGEWFLIDTNTGQYVMVPGIGRALDAIPQGPTLESFLDRTFKDQWFERTMPDKRRENR
ncbi:MAG: SMI1/KNR4 family protein [Planctomycetota bacterium]